MNWTARNAPISQLEMEDNGRLIAGYFTEKGWTYQAISAMLGNMEIASGVNPGAYENYTSTPNRLTGYGLNMWWPWTIIRDWAEQLEIEMYDGYGQCDYIMYEYRYNLHYQETSKYPLSFDEFTVSSRSPDYLSLVWLYNYQTPEVIQEEKTKENALKWYQLLTGFVPGRDKRSMMYTPNKHFLMRRNRVI